MSDMTGYEELIARSDDATKVRIYAGEIHDLKAELADIKDKVRYWSYCTSQGMLATCPEKVMELADFLMALKISPWYVRNNLCETVRVARTEEES